MKYQADGRRIGWIRLKHPSYAEANNDSDMYRWTEALDSLRRYNPALYKRVMDRHLCDEVNQLRKEYLDLRWPAEPAQADPEPEQEDE
jgi:hypothetical protein